MEEFQPPAVKPHRSPSLLMAAIMLKTAPQGTMQGRSELCRLRDSAHSHNTSVITIPQNT